MTERRERITMWQVLLDLLYAERRPLVFLDFETSGLGGAPPVEFALLVWAPWEAPQTDDLTRATSRVVPPGLTYACERRVNPKRPIDPGAQRVHKIADADVKGATAYDDLEIRAFFQGWASGDAGDGTGPAIFVGHNAAGADVPWARMWGYLPPADLAGADLDVIDTMRIVRRLQKAEPFPLSVDVLTTVHRDEDHAISGGAHVPAIRVGLDVFASSLVGSHVALCGERPPQEHGALADCCSTARVFCRLLDLWGPLWPPRRSDLPASANLSALLAALDAPPPGQVSWDGWLTEYDGPEVPGAPQYIWARGKQEYRGRPAHRDRWVLSLPRAPTGIDGQGWCSSHTATILSSLPPLTAVR